MSTAYSAVKKELNKESEEIHMDEIIRSTASSLTHDDERLLVKYADTVITEDGAQVPAAAEVLAQIICSTPPELVGSEKSTCSLRSSVTFMSVVKSYLPDWIAGIRPSKATSPSSRA